MILSNAYGSSYNKSLFYFRILILLLIGSTWIMADSVFSMAAIQRTLPSVGVIAAVSGDSEISFVEAGQWRTAEIRQDLSAGDGLRTGSFGTMALLFADHTQIRVQRRSLLTVKAIAENLKTGISVFRLERGGVWSRAAVGGSGVRIETPSATAAIRGTDWSITVDEKGKTRLIVLDGTVELENKLGRVSVHRGEVAFAEIGKAPTKTILIHPRDRHEQIYNFSLADGVQGFKLTDFKVSELCRKRKKMEAIEQKQRSADQWLDLAELAYDMGDRAAARQFLESVKAKDARLRARVELVQGYLALFDFDWSAAEHRLAAAAPDLDHGRSLKARIGRVSALLLLRRNAEAKDQLSQLRHVYGDDPRFLLFSSILTAFSGDIPSALQQLTQQTKRFPDKAAFPAVESVFQLILDRPEEAASAAKRALAIDSSTSAARVVLSSYLHNYLGDSEGAIDVLRQGLVLNGHDDSLWGELGLVYTEIEEQKLSEEALLKAIELNPHSVAALYNYALLLLEQFRITEADAVLKRVDRIDPGRDFVLVAQGRLAMQTNRMAQARESLLKATTVNPAMSYASTLLARDYYLTGELAQARQTLNNADRLDTNEPLIPLIGSVIAADHAQADQAIEYAQEAIRRYRKIGGTGITGLAASRGGNTNLGAAFANLGLSDWADMYAELSFDPYSAESHMFRAARDKDGLSSLFQGLLIDPLSAASRNRFVDFYRRPFNDSSVGVSVGWPANGTSSGGSVNVQGFSFDPKPTSYWLNVDHNETPNDRENNDERQSMATAVIGINITPYDRLLFDFEATDSRSGLPGPVSLPDFDDDKVSQGFIAGLGYSHYFGARNILLGRISAFSLEAIYSNEDPLGSTDLSRLDYSLITNFGLEGARLLHDYGLTDLTDPADPDSPIVRIGRASGLLPNTISSTLDVNPIKRTSVKEHALSFKLRHMFILNPVDFSYGVEVMSFYLETITDSLELRQRNQGMGLLVGPNGSTPFLFGDPLDTRQSRGQNGLAANGHVDALWRVNKTLRFEAGLFAQQFDNDFDTSSTRIDPRIGAAWEIDSSDWLRFILRRDMRMPFLYTLFPVATVGIAPDTEFLTSGSQSRLYAARWDREWNRHFFTTLELRRQDIDDFSSSVPDSLIAFNVDRGRIDQAVLAANLWIKGGIGLFARATLSASENRSDGADSDHGLPLVPEHRYTTGVTWIHPAQVRVTLSANFVGEQAEDVSGDGVLSGYETADLTATWQPLKKHLELGLTATNLFDRDYEAGPGIPARGRLITVSAKWRF